MKVQQMISKTSGNPVANQFILRGTFDGGQALGMLHRAKVFQSYDSVIAVVVEGKTFLDANTWDYSRTTSKYRNQFLGESTQETKNKIANGEYQLVELNHE
jgi:hypothetical protein